MVGTTSASALDGIKVFPNPASEAINFEGPVWVRTARLLDLAGREMRRQSFEGTNGSFPVMDLRRGVCFLELTGASGARNVRRIMIE
jgi:hypothetical protein